MDDQPADPPKKSPAKSGRRLTLKTAVAWAAILGTAATIVYTGITWKIGRDVKLAREEDERRRKKDEAEAKVDALPALEYVAGSHRERDGFTFVSLRNKSRSTAAAITRVDFVVTDLQSLAAIRRIVPDEPPLIVDANPADTVPLSKGRWYEHQFVMESHPGIHIPQDGKPHDLQLDFDWTNLRDLAGKHVRGHLIVWYERDGGSEGCKIDDLSVLVRP